MYQTYVKKPYGKYINVEKWDMCIDCFKEILLEIKRRKEK